jgi:nucleoid DNA-binding protein
MREKMLMLETASYGRPGWLTIICKPAPATLNDEMAWYANPLDHTTNSLYDEDVVSHCSYLTSLGVKALIKQDIIHQVIAKTGLPRNKAEAAVDTVFESLKKALASGDRIELRGFGVFNVRPRKTGIGRNPRTGAEVTITPGKAVRFKPGKELHLLDS